MILRLLTVTAMLIACCACGAADVGIPAQPIPQDENYALISEELGFFLNPDFVEGYENPLPHLALPQNPFMAANGRSNMHNDAYMSDTYEAGGPIGLEPTVISTYRWYAECATVVFDSRGRIWTVCTNISGPALLLLDAYTLNELASYPLPPRHANWESDPIGPLQDTSGGAYFCLDDRDRAVVSTHNHSIQIIEYKNGDFILTDEYDLEGYVVPQEPPLWDKVGAALPDWEGRLWFVTRYGMVGAIDIESGAVHTVELCGEEIQNSFTVGEDGVYIVSDYALYRFHADEHGQPVQDWRTEYDRGTRVKPGMINQGSGTTPNLFGDMVAIADNADPRMNIIFLRRSDGAEVCRIPVFSDNESCTENALIGLAREGDNGIEYSVIVENNYGYEHMFTPTGGASTVGGVARIDAVPDGSGGYTCVEVWSSPEISLTAVPKMSLATGLIYLYTKYPREDGIDAWYLTAVDFESGETVWRVLTGTGQGYNNNYAPIILGPQGGTVYIGTLNGLIAVRDSDD